MSPVKLKMLRGVTDLIPSKISTPDGIGVARDPFALKPLLYAESDEVALIASEEVAIRAVDQDAALVPRELAAGEVRWWLR